MALAFLRELHVVSSAETGQPPALRAVPMGAGAGLTIEGGRRVLERRVVVGDHTSRVVKLLLQRRGEALLSHAGRQAELAQGDLALIDGAQDFRLDMPGPSDQSVVVLPRDLALAWGFSGEAHFSGAFRRKFGEGPRAFRRRAHPGKR